MTLSNNEETLVEVKGLRRHFGDVKAVDDIDFSFRSGEVHGFIGPNGAGKTTAMRIIATLDNPDSGDVLVNGRSLINYPDKIRPILGFMPDYLDSYRDMVVDEYLDFYARAFKLEPHRRCERLGLVVEFTGLAELTNRPVAALSKGQKQRLSLARVLINDPQVLILDEPAAGLDPRARVELRNLIRVLADKGKAVFVSSHILTELSEICDAVTIIENGQVCASDYVNNLQRDIDNGLKVAVHLLEPSDTKRGELVRILAETPGVMKVEDEKHGASFICDGEPKNRVKILRLLIEKGFSVTDFHSDTSDLEDAFMHLTDGKDK